MSRQPEAAGEPTAGRLHPLVGPLARLPSSLLERIQALHADPHPLPMSRWSPSSS
jgi:hypothetical protein